MKFLILVLLSLSAHADLVINVGSGKGITGAPGTPFERTVIAGYQLPFDHDLFFRPEVGYYISGGRGESSSWISVPLGVRALSRTGTEWHVAVGPSYLSNPDYVILGGHFQFSLEGCVGIVGKVDALALCWDHISSASIYPVNQGRDFLTIQVRFLNL